MNNIPEIKLEDLGYGPFFEDNRAKLGLREFAVGRVTSESKGAYQVRNETGEYRAQVTGKHLFTASSREDFPAVGDWVALEILGKDQAVIRGILPRSSVIKRKHGDRSRTGEKSTVQIIAANIDVAFVIESVDRDYSLNRFERFLAIAEGGKVRPVIVLNKTDLLSQEELAEKLEELKQRFPATDILATNTARPDGLSALKSYIVRGKTYCFLGSSGVGKSSLINALLGKNVIKTGDVSSYSDRGKHTTTSRQMYFLEQGGIVVDNPGIREVGIADTGRGVDSLFDEITVLGRECRYADCTHTHEPGCNVVRAVKAGELDEEKYSNYIHLKKETEYQEMSDVEKREKDRQFGKFIKRAKKDLDELDHP